MTPDKPVFTFNNTGIHHDYVMPFFALFDWLLQDEHRVYDYIERLGYYSPKDFNTLKKRFETEAEAVPLNINEAIILTSVIHYICCLFVTEDEDEVLRKLTGEDDTEFLDTRNRLLVFGRVAIEKLTNDLGKKNAVFLTAAEKIRLFNL